MILIDKQIGDTPLEALNKFRQNHPDYKDARLSYAGRLDPMASGLLLVLEGEENDNREDFLALDKTYEFQMLIGVSTDTFDLLGVVEEVADTVPVIEETKIQSIFDDFVGKWRMTYPPFSSKTVSAEGEQTPLWQLARRNTLPRKLPTKKVQIHQLSCQSVQVVKADYIIDYIIDYIKNVTGDFRQEKIINTWEEKLSNTDVNFQLARCEIDCSSGTYIRRLVQEVGKQLGYPATAFSITRIRVGEYDIDSSQNRQ